MKTGAPSIVTERLIKGWDYVLFALLSALSIAATVGFLAHWLSFQDWGEYPISLSTMTVMLVVVLTNHQGRWFLLLCMRKPQRMPPRQGWKVAVATTFVPGAEALEMLERTVKALVALEYPHDTWVLDEADDEAVKALCRNYGAIHFSRRNYPSYLTNDGSFRSGTKYGNYNAWFSEVGFERYDIITTFDPDHIPAPEFLTSVLGYFDDPKIAYVQVAQSYYNQKASFIARGAAEETYEYYSVVQMASYGMGYPIIVGSHNTHRVAALKQVGGFAAHDADDLLLTLKYRAAGWQGVYVPKILSKGLTPVDWRGYLRQQRRWARSVLDVKLCRYAEYSRNLSTRSKLMNVLHGLNFLHRSLLIFVAIILSGIMLAAGITDEIVSWGTLGWLGLLWIVLHCCELYRQRFYLDPQEEKGFHWRAALLQYAKWPWFMLALIDVLTGRRVPYVLTSKVKLESRQHVLLWPNLGVILFLAGAWFISWRSGSKADPLLYAVCCMFIISSVLLIWTELWSFPAPYSKELAEAVFPEASGQSLSGQKGTWRVTGDVAAGGGHDSWPG